MNHNFPPGSIPPNVPIYYVQHYPSPPPQYSSPYPPQPYSPQQYPLQQPLAPGQYIISQNPNKYANPSPPISQNSKEGYKDAKNMVKDEPKSNLPNKIENCLEKFQAFRLKIKPFVPLIILTLLSINVALIDRLRDSRDVCGYSSYTKEFPTSNEDFNTTTSNNSTRKFNDITANVTTVILTNNTNNSTNILTLNQSNSSTIPNNTNKNNTTNNKTTNNNSNNSNNTIPSSNGTKNKSSQEQDPNTMYGSNSGQYQVVIMFIIALVAAAIGLLLPCFKGMTVRDFGACMIRIGAISPIFSTVLIMISAVMMKDCLAVGIYILVIIINAFTFIIAIFNPWIKINVKHVATETINTKVTYANTVTKNYERKENIYDIS